MRGKLPLMFAFLLGSSGCSVIVAPDAGLLGSGGAGGGAGGTGGGIGGQGGQGAQGGAGGGCAAPSDCPDPANECEEATCVGGACGTQPVTQGTPLARQMDGDCVIAVCDGSGGTEDEVDDTDLPVDNDECTDDVCTNGVPTNPDSPVGTPCGVDLACDGMGNCAGCTSPAQCPGMDDECQTRTCQNSLCGVINEDAGTPVSMQTAGDCQETQCDGSGGTQQADDDADVPDDGLDCTIEGCMSGTPTTMDAMAGAPCNDGGVMCDGMGVCVDCILDGDCGTTTECRTYLCSAGSCSFMDTMSGTPVSMQTAGDCLEVQCNGMGGTNDAVDDSDLPVDGNECTGDVCTNGVATNPNEPSGTPCTVGGNFCNGAGLCVECTLGSQCTSGVCTNNVCQPALCTDGIQNGSETDIDCGGPSCAPCDIGDDCLIDADCVTNNCATTCQPVAVQSTTPASGATNVAVGSSITIEFTAAVNPTTLTLKTALDDGACTGTVQVSTDDFATCIPAAAPNPSMGGGNTLATIDPSPGLSFGSTYRVRVLSGVLDGTGAGVTPFTMGPGFTTQLDGLAGVVISRVYGAGGNSGAIFTNDFIELHNRSSVAVDLAGWSVQYASSGGSTWQVQALAGTIPAGGSYLVQEAGGANGSPLPTPDASGTISMAAAAGKVALVSNATALSGTCPSGGAIVDFVGYGAAASCFEGAAPTGDLSATQTGIRNGGGCVDAGDNALDFTVSASTTPPRNSASPPRFCGPVANETGGAEELDYCVLQFPLTTSAQTGTPVATIFGRVYELGMTEAAGANPAVLAELGFGPRSANPQHESGWTWAAAAYNAGFVDPNNDEYMFDLTAPAPGAYAYTFRFSIDGGLTWTYCDNNGAGANSSLLVFETPRLGLLTVTP